MKRYFQDFAVTLIFAVFWLSGSAAWANGLSAVRAGANPNEWITVLNGADVPICDPKIGFECKNVVEGAFGGLVISIVSSTKI